MLSINQKIKKLLLRIKLTNKWHRRMALCSVIESLAEVDQRTKQTVNETLELRHMEYLKRWPSMESQLGRTYAEAKVRFAKMLENWGRYPEKTFQGRALSELRLLAANAIAD